MHIFLAKHSETFLYGCGFTFGLEKLRLIYSVRASALVLDRLKPEVFLLVYVVLKALPSFQVFNSVFKSLLQCPQKFFHTGNSSHLSAV